MQITGVGWPDEPLDGRQVAEKTPLALAWLSSTTSVGCGGGRGWAGNGKLPGRGNGCFSLLLSF